MAFGSSGAFIEWPKAMYGTRPTTYGSMTADTFKAALYNNTGTPDKAAAGASTGYNTGAWVTANEVSGTNWAAAGVALASKTFASASNVLTFDAADTASAGNTTLSGVMGCLVYDDTITAAPVADMGVCFNYFGGAQSVTAGTFTIVWNASGIMTLTV